MPKAGASDEPTDGQTTRPRRERPGGSAGRRHGGASLGHATRRNALEHFGEDLPVSRNALEHFGEDLLHTAHFHENLTGRWASASIHFFGTASSVGRAADS